MSDPVSFAIKKIVESTVDSREYFLSSFATDLLLTQAIVYNVSNLAEYIGFTLPGTSKAEPKWLIKKLTYSGNYVTDIQFANGEAKFNKVMNSYNLYTYS
jgi:hypothetical protein